MAILSKSKSAIYPVTKVMLKAGALMGPTGVGVLLSIGAHAALWAFGPRTNFSFAALTQAAQQAGAEETIVPLVQLTAAEQSRLPDFAQPGRLPPDPTGLGNFSLPSGLPAVPNAAIPRGQTSRTLASSQLGRMPSTTTWPPTRTFTSRTSQPFNLGVTVPNANLGRSPSFAGVQANPNPQVTVVPPPPSTASETPSNPSAASSATDNDNSASDLLPNLSSQETISFGEALARANSENSSENSTSNIPDIGDRIPETASTSEEPGETPTDESSSTIAASPAEENTSPLTAGFIYNETDVSPAAAKVNTDEWLIASAEGRENMATATAALTLDYRFRVCKEIQPASGLVGVVVNPDGTQDSMTLLKSTGYDFLNGRALDAVKYSDFGKPEVPTQYQVQIDVPYNPEDCVEALPETPPE
ncbi:MAG: hypothetical protein HC800_09180 [Phormidesmis sp. RL_2_1]|nr:hypothetical protein [Phormidesmis sp. RL_2_1]